MARNSRVLVRQLLGNPLNPCAALLHHHNHKHPLSFIKTLTVSVPITPSLPPRPPPPAIPSSSRLFCTLDSSSKKEIIIGSYSRWSINYKGYSDIPLILLHNHYDQYVSAVKTIQVSHVTSDMFMEMCEPFPHVIAYEFLLDPEEDNYKSILENLNIPRTPTFHFYQNGKKVAEITRKNWESEAYEISLKKTLVKLYVPQPRERSSDKEERSRVEDTLRYRKITWQ
ncbi:thioredoxin O1 [Pyrus ussuriensis x Pyrus communis]|uniref:Thioredoxin O1 n=1 Tax=Pyrus ussuriensis x Pyrus communis TaxID=2448454 RepID=A0A5N5G2F9_9ROSA|nr:thioredoxin O1 [Pyrus ussuriensis x Pyrus communis]